jgi:hypothetical protein
VWDSLPDIEASEQDWAGVRWFPGCFAGDQELHAFRIGVAADFKAWQLFGEDLQGIIESIVSEASLVYEAQMNIRLEIADLELHEAAASEPSWVSGCDAGNEVRSKLTDFTAWNKPSTQAVWHLFTGCGNSFGVIGVAYVGRICAGYANTGVNMLRNWRGRVVEDTWDTFAHELGHNFNARHSFEEGRGTTGGIMDYGDGKLNGIYQFNTQYRKQEMCAELQREKPLCGDRFEPTAPAGPQPSPQPTPQPGTGFEMVRVSEVPEGERCGGDPISIRGKTWANLGKDLSLESCKAACLSEELCSFAIFRPSNGACSAFASCDTSFAAKAFFENWQKVPVDAPTSAPSPPSPTPALPRMAPADFVPPGHRCAGAPRRIDGATWGNLGMGTTPQACQEACLSDARCSFAVFKTTRGACSAYSSCSQFDERADFLVWMKITE